MSKIKNGFYLSTSKLDVYVGSIMAATSAPAILDLCAQFADELDTSYFAYGLMWIDSFNEPRYIVETNYVNEAWIDIYSQGYAYIDPRQKDGFSSAAPVFWSTQGPYMKNRDEEEKLMMADAHKHGIRAGVLVPFRDFYGRNGAFGLSHDVNDYSDSSEQHLRQIAPYVSYIGMFVHQAMIIQFEQCKDEEQDSLSNREKDCLRCAADGMQASGIASKLIIAETTVKFHLKNAMRKLGAKNTSQAVAFAVHKGHITADIVSR